MNPIIYKEIKIFRHENMADFYAHVKDNTLRADSVKALKVKIDEEQKREIKRGVLAYVRGYWDATFKKCEVTSIASGGSFGRELWLKDGDNSRRIERVADLFRADEKKMAEILALECDIKERKDKLNGLTTELKWTNDGMLKRWALRRAVEMELKPKNALEEELVKQGLPIPRCATCGADYVSCPCCQNTFCPRCGE